MALEELNERLTLLDWDFVYELTDWGRDGCREYKSDLFYEQYLKYDRFVVAKAFADAYTKNNVSLIASYITNPIRYSCNWGNEECLMDKENFLMNLSDRINDLHFCGKVTATLIPTIIKPKYTDADVLIRAKGTGSIKLHLNMFLNCIYKI